MNTSRISVIIPVYNHAPELVACLRSLKQQTAVSLEIIVVDDGSIDHPKEAVQSAGLFTEVAAWIDLETNHGAPVARNRGFAASSGSFVIFLDADAVVRPDGMHTLQQALLDHPEAAFSYGAFRFGKKLFLSEAFSLESLARQNYIHTSGLIRREAFPGFDPSLKKFQDWDLWLQIAEAGGEGIYVPEVLMDIRERVQYGMSRWIPAIAYRLPWRWIGHEPAAVTSFKQAEQVIRQKHGAWMRGVEAQAVKPTMQTRGWAGLAMALAVLSFITIGTVWSALLSGMCALAMIWIAYRKPAFALALLGFELMLGSKGGWLKIGADAVNDGGIGIRIVLFAAFFIGWGVRLIQQRRELSLKRPLISKETLPLVGLVAVLGVAVFRGWLFHHPFFLPDANAWGFLLALVPAVVLWNQQERVLIAEFRSMIPVATGLLVTATLGLFLLFSQAAHIPMITEALYIWVRQSGLGEITRTAYGIHRIFFASQIMLVLAWIWLYVRATQARHPLTLRTWGLWMVTGAALIVSFSRSFWIGLFVAGLTVALVAFGSSKDSIKERLQRIILRPGIAILGAFAGIFLVASFALSSAIGSRFRSGEAAASSRWNLLPIMQQGIRQHPLLGSGFGATLTYESRDPRVVEKTGGMYTTYAFEWGWLDIWYKMGIFGVGVLAWVLGQLLVRATSTSLERRLFVWGSVLALASIHVFTPYLNHPLGIGALIFLLVYTFLPGQQKNRAELS